MISTNNIRVFFAIWPGKVTEKHLYDLSTKLSLSQSERMIRPEDFHLTLVFLGEITVGQIEKLCLAANTIRTKKFDLIIDRISYLKSNRLIYATTNVVPLELLNLVDSLRAAISANGFLFDNRAFMPHITLVRNVRRTSSLHQSPYYKDFQIIWPVNEWILMKSEKSSDRSLYTPIRRWTLL